MKRSEKWLMIALTVALLGVIATGVAVADNSSTNAQSPQNLYQAFLGNLASALGVNQATLTDAIQAASTQTVNQELKNGQITQQQADQILFQINKGIPFFGFMGPGLRGGGPGGDFMILKPLADTLSMDSKDVISAIQGGKTVSDLAASKNLSVTDLQSKILGSIKSQLDQAVSNGSMTADQENQIYSKLEQSVNSGDWITQLQKIGKAGDHPQPPADQQPTQ